MDTAKTRQDQGTLAHSEQPLGLEQGLTCASNSLALSSDLAVF